MNAIFSPQIVKTFTYETIFVVLFWLALCQNSIKKIVLHVACVKM